MKKSSETHSLTMGYLLWLFGFTGAHRFYFGRPVSGTIYFFTFGLFGIGWLFDAIWMPRLASTASQRYFDGESDYNISWVLLTFFGVLGVHRFYLGKWVSGLLYLVTGGLFGMGYLYDYWTLNQQVSILNSTGRR
jgi:TM2 domain-containing membrane protein YozV